MNGKQDRASAWRQGKVGWLAVVAMLIAVSAAPAQETGKADQPAPKLEASRYWATLEPSTVFSPKPSYRIGGMRHTVFRPARIEAGEGQRVSVYSEAEWKVLRIGWDAFRERAAKAAEAQLDQLRPVWKRDSRGRVVYAEIHLPQGGAPGFLLAPGLRERFSEQLGESVLVVAPTSRRLLVFPAAGRVLAAIGEAVQTIHENSREPASREIFLLEKGKPLRVVGILGEENVPVPIDR